MFKSTGSSLSLLSVLFGCLGACVVWSWFVCGVRLAVLCFFGGGRFSLWSVCGVSLRGSVWFLFVFVLPFFVFLPLLFLCGCCGLFSPFCSWVFFPFVLVWSSSLLFCFSSCLVLPSLVVFFSFVLFFFVLGVAFSCGFLLFCFVFLRGWCGLPFFLFPSFSFPFSLCFLSFVSLGSSLLSKLPWFEKFFL
ncbi:unnamed protein product [Polarella glacialis]|uniref:Uncharacterized protein n=1 Tax=Polarella glacialis TaxID=89957 RepID=A0A813JBU0_POLGL|nr:unnamed protein product [Polarella glacialis]